MKVIGLGLKDTMHHHHHRQSFYTHCALGIDLLFSAPSCWDLRQSLLLQSFLYFLITKHGILQFTYLF